MIGIAGRLVEVVYLKGMGPSVPPEENISWPDWEDSLSYRISP
jgi:hypothetical protein